MWGLVGAYTVWQDFVPSMPRLQVNEYLKLAGIFYSAHAIVRNIAPLASSGLKHIETDTFNIHFFVSPTGTSGGAVSAPPCNPTAAVGCPVRLTCMGLAGGRAKPVGTTFFVITDTGAQSVEAILHRIYELYTDYVLKNPFQELDMPIQCSAFNLQLDNLIAPLNRGTVM